MADLYRQSKGPRRPVRLLKENLTPAKNAWRLQAENYQTQGSIKQKLWQWRVKYYLSE